MTWDEQHRHDCEVRHVVRLRKESQERAYRYLELVAQRRGKPAAEKLKQDAATLYAKGKHGI